MAKKVLKALTKKFGDAIVSTDDALGDEVVCVKPGKLIDVATFLRDDKKMLFDAPVFVTCIDRIGTDAGETARFEVCYQLRSTVHHHRIRIKIAVTEKSPKVKSLAGLWVGFLWQERETYDMYGIEFDGHPDLRRIYLYPEFVGYPLRKDYPKEKRQPLARRDDAGNR